MEASEPTKTLIISSLARTQKPGTCIVIQKIAIDGLVEQYNYTLFDLPDKNVPKKTIIRPSPTAAPWCSQDIKYVKTACRRAERT